ncbi:MAG: hypothetical protein HRU78_03665 [Gammaproteobacteria bacterium]|nr:MAG: hypothetical protein HRU78_03665 [Gammaproteobacteria bacterium]
MSAATELEFEFENESEFELANELEHELGLASELVHEFELEHEQQAEHEAFFNHLAAMADRSGRSQALRRIALAAARSALKGQSKPWPVIAGEGELEFAGELGELELEHEFEHEYSPAQIAQFAAMMEHAGHAAAEAANEQEAAEHFLPLIGLAAKFIVPKLVGLAAKKVGGMAAKKIGGQLLRRAVPRLIKRVTPQLTRGVANMTRTLYRNPTTRSLLHAMPRIARGTITRLGRQIASGQRITPQQAVRTLAQQTVRTLSNPKTLVQTYRRSRALDHRYHQHTRRVLGRPAGAPVRAATNAGVAPYGTVPAAGWMAAPATGGCRCAYQPVGVCPACGR